MSIEKSLLFNHINSIINEFYFNQVSSELLNRELGDLFHVPQLNVANNKLLDYMYDAKTLNPIFINKTIGYAATTRSLKNILKPTIASVLHEISELINVKHYEPHCGSYLKLKSVNEIDNSGGYRVEFESFALPFIKQKTLIKSIHDLK